jgi:ribosomal RNA-processing protein 12
VDFVLSAYSKYPLVRGTSYWSVRGDGAITLLVRADIREDAPELPRFGLRLEMPKGFEQVEYYGNGPHDSYIDMHHLCRKGRFASSVDALFTHYLVPQEKTDELAIAAANVMCDIIDVCIKEPMIQQARQAAHSAAGLPSPLEAVASHAVVLLQARFKRNWHCSLAIVQSLINRLGVNCSPLMDRAVAALIDMQPRLPTIKGASPRSADELEQALGAAIVKMGPARVLELAPLIGHDGSEELQIAHPSNKLWLLPLLKKFVRAAPLAYFVRSLLPLADQIEAAAIAADARKMLVEAKNLMHVNRQIWGLLPSFCLECVDLPEALPHVARRMGTSIESEPELRNIVCSALLNAIRSMRKASDTDQSMDEDECMVTAEAAARGTAAIASFAKNFLPILFNAASTVPIAERPLLLETICEYAQITEAPRLTALFQNVMKKLLTAAAADGEMTDDTETETSKILLLDLALSLMPALDTSNAEFLYKSAIPFVADASGGVQKRAYKLLQLMSHAHTAMMQSRLAHVQEAMVEALPGLQPGASKWRLRCIAKLVEHLPFDVAYMQLLGAVMGEVILGTKSAARKTREVSFAVLVTVAQKVDAGSNGAQLGDLFTMLLAGLAGTTNTMVSATVYALSRLVYEYSDRVGQLAPPLLESVMLLFQQKSREVVTAALGFAKVAVVSLTPDVLRTYMKSLITNLLLWSGDTRNRFRLKVKVPIPLLTHLPPLPRSTRAHTSAGEDGRMTGLRSRGCVCSGSPGASDAAYILRGGARGHT